MDAPQVDCRHQWQPFYDAPEIDTCAWCGAEQPVGLVARTEPSQVA